MYTWLILNLVVSLLDSTQSQLNQYRNNRQGNRRAKYQQQIIKNYNKKVGQIQSTTVESPKLDQSTVNCGVRHSKYQPDQKARRGRIIWTDEESQGAKAAPDGSFPWMASLFLRQSVGEQAYFLCAATILTPKVLVSAAHCFNDKYRDKDWFIRVGDNFIGAKDPSEQTFQVRLILKHPKFVPLTSPGGDGSNDIALLYIRTINSTGIIFNHFVGPACLPQSGTGLRSWKSSKCEIAGWGMQEFDNTASYPDSIRAAKIQVSNVPSNVCDYLYGRDVSSTGKFCAGGSVDACQEDSGGPLMCSYKGKHHLVGLVSSGKGCGSYPGLYTDVSRYESWIVKTVHRILEVLN